ncbi:hypothetical protein CUN33_09280 [Enterococcus faecium]|nr:hypothetical protein CUN33_09280 [Enterococcus faecium]
MTEELTGQHRLLGKKDCDKNFVTILFVFLNNRFFFSFSYIIICQIKRDKTFHLRNSKKLLMVFGNLVIF